MLVLKFIRFGFTEPNLTFFFNIYQIFSHLLLVSMPHSLILTHSLRKKKGHFLSHLSLNPQPHILDITSQISRSTLLLRPQRQFSSLTLGSPPSSSTSHLRRCHSLPSLFEWKALIELLFFLMSILYFFFIVFIL